MPEPLMGNIEAEAAALGISVPELCRRIIVERNHAVEREGRTERVTSIPISSSSLDKSGNHRIETSAPSPVGLSQKEDATLVAAMAATELAKIRAEFPELSPPTRNMILAREALAKLAEKHPDKFDDLIAKLISKGEMSGRELVDFLELLAR